MKRTIFVIIALFLILGLRLAAYSGDIPSEPTPLPTPTEDPAFADRIFVEVTPSPTPTRGSLAGERKSEAVTPYSTTTTEEESVREVTPSSTSAGDSLAGERKSEEVMPSPPPTEERIVREPTPSPTPVGDLLAGEKLFASACKICHRKDMIRNDFVASKTDQELFEFIETGGLPNQPLVMLPKGGKPSLTDEKLYDIVAYLRSLQE